MNTLAQLGTSQPGLTLASMGQRYKTDPTATFDQRFGPYDAHPDAEMMRRLFEQEVARQQQEEMLRNTPGGIIPGTQLVDPNGFRGERHPSGYYMLRGI